MAARGSAASAVGQAYSRAQTLCEQLGDREQRFPILRGVWAHHLVRGALQCARELGEQLLVLTAGATDSMVHAEARFALGGTFFWRGELAASRLHIGQGLPHTRHLDDAAAYMFGQHPEVGCLSYEIMNLLILGYPDQAQQQSHRSLVDSATERGHPLTLAYAHFFEAVFAQLRQEVPNVRTHAQAVIRLAHEQGSPYWLSMGTVLEGWARAVQGDATEGMTQIQHGLQEFRKTGAALALPYFLGLFADTYARKSQGDGLCTPLIEAGLASLAEALACSERTGERIYAAELYRFKGELLSQQARAGGSASSLPPDTCGRIADCFQHALSIARRQQAKLFELRAAVSLTRFWQACETERATVQQKRQAARRDLQQVYDWFTEGWATDPLRQARMVLEALGDDA